MTDMTPAKRLAKVDELLKDAERLLKAFSLNASTVNLFIRNYNSICDGDILTTFEEFDSKKIYLTGDFTEILEQIHTNLSSYVNYTHSIIPNTENPNEPNISSTQGANDSMPNGNKNNIQETPEAKSSSLPRFIIELIVLFLGCGTFHTIGLHQGENSEKNSQFEKIETLKHKNTMLNDSLKLLNSKLQMNSTNSICSDTIKIIQKDTVKLVQTDTIRDTIKIKEKNILIKKGNDTNEKNEACILRNEIKSINPDYGHVSGYLESIAERFKKFAKRNAMDSIEFCNPLGEALGYLNECGRNVLETIKGSLDLYIRNNKLNCNN